VRRLLIESAWHHRKFLQHPPDPRCGPRWAKVDPGTFEARGHAGNRRLNKRWRHFTERGKNPLVANVAIGPRNSPAGAGHWRPCNSTGRHPNLADPGDQTSVR